MLEHSEAARIVGERIRATRQQLGLSQEDLADLAEMHVTNVGKVERGQTNPSLSTLVALSGALNAELDGWVAGLTAAMIPGRTHRLSAAEFLREQASRRA
ncbi:MULTISPECIES: helix-turn-helix domain-containing protein [Subtercola]|uniref:XRE family transcriptional regulator n=1 Tax=Subtercola vilae TaxID=2056433 RepID=A0A4T2CEU3_9MICO|nr:MULTISPECIES: helix-turn-helix transcriptional regulator [Subtercola]MEA9983714.1 helix-turn-helix transcriptional regulator [Subtercola sp. RTI3]TIH40738.1 XRE family transcriptional regulator [Subtercola vilae]